MGQALVTGSKISYQCGVIKLDEEQRFKRTVFRITKGNSLVVCIPFSDLFVSLVAGEENRVVFFVLYPGGADSYLDRKLTKLVENFCQGKYELPENEAQFLSIHTSLESEFVETENLLALTEGELTDFLLRLVEPMAESEFFRRHEYLKLYIMKEKDLYVTLN